MRIRAAILCVLLIAAAVGPAWGETVITASNNAFVAKGAPTTDQNEAESLLVKSDGGNSLSRFAYMRFDVSGRNAQDTVFLDLNLVSVASDAVRLDVWLLNDGTAGETTWNSGMTWDTRPDGTTALPNANTTAVNSYGSNTAGIISIPIPAALWPSILSGDSNNEITLILSNDAGNSSGISTFSSIGNTGGYLKPRLRVLSQTAAETIPESGYGGRLRRDTSSGTVFTWNNGLTTAEVGQGGSGQIYRFNHFLLFQLPARPSGGFTADDTSLSLTEAGGDAWGTGAHADIWAVGYLTAGDLASVGTQLNNGGATDIDDFALIESDSETKAGWNIGGHNTVKIWDNMASGYSVNTLGAPPDVCTNLTSFINDLFDNHGASAGDYLILRNNMDAAVGTSRNWLFYTGDAAATNKPVLTLSKEHFNVTLFCFH